MAIAVAGVAITLFLATSLSERTAITAAVTRPDAAVARLVVADSVIRVIYLFGAVLAWTVCLPVAALLRDVELRGIAFVVLLAAVASACLCVALAAMNKEAVETLSYRTAAGEVLVARMEKSLRDLEVRPAENRTHVWGPQLLGPAAAGAPMFVVVLVGLVRDGTGAAWEVWFLSLFVGVGYAVTAALLREGLVDRARGRRLWWVMGALWITTLLLLMGMALSVAWDQAVTTRERMTWIGVVLVAVLPTLAPLLTLRCRHQKRLTARSMKRNLDWVKRNQL